MKHFGKDKRTFHHVNNKKDISKDFFSNPARILTAIIILSILLVSVLVVLVFIWQTSEMSSSAADVSQNSQSGSDSTLDNDNKTTGMQVVNSTDDLITRTGWVDDISVIEYNNTTNEKKPVIVFLHGVTSNKESFEMLATTVAKDGFFVISLDAYAHGERNETDPLSVFEIAAQTSEELDVIFDYYEDNENCDLSNITLCGFSMGGFASYHYGANGERTPQNIMTICSSPYWEDMIGVGITYSTYENKALIDFNEEHFTISEIDTFLTENSPYDALIENGDDTNYYMILGEEDEIVTHEGAEKFYIDMYDTYPDTVEYHLVENLGHNITDDVVLALHDKILSLL